MTAKQLFLKNIQQKIARLQEIHDYNAQLSDDIFDILGNTSSTGMLSNNGHFASNNGHTIQHNDETIIDQVVNQPSISYGENKKFITDLLTKTNIGVLKTQ